MGALVARVQLLMAIIACTVCYLDASALCTSNDWRASYTQDVTNLAKCNPLHTYIKSLSKPAYKNVFAGDLYTWHLDVFQCCKAPEEWWPMYEHTEYVNLTTFARTLNTWGSCSQGFFLDGLLINPKEDYLRRYVEARCKKPATHPNSYPECYERSKSNCSDAEEWCGCKEGFYVTALYHNNVGYLQWDITKFRCCSMFAPQGLVTEETVCASNNWTASYGEKSENLGRCYREHAYIRNLRAPIAVPGVIGPPNYEWHLDIVQCCKYQQEWWKMDELVIFVDWTDFALAGKWGSCPLGYFLDGLWINPNATNLARFIEGRCKKPVLHPDSYPDCYDKDKLSLDFTTAFEWGGCKEGYYVTAFYHNEYGMIQRNFDKLRCCSMWGAPQELETEEMAKGRMQDLTLLRLAFLANNLGYAWTHGCGTDEVGQHFTKTSIGWEVKNVSRCYWNKERDGLKIVYGDWKLNTMRIDYGVPKIETIRPNYSVQKVIINQRDYVNVEDIKYEMTSSRMITHIKSSAWKESHAFGPTLAYSVPSGTVSSSATYRFPYENLKTTRNSNNEEDERKFSIFISKTMLHKAAHKIKITLNKVRRTIAYNATISVMFSAELQGQLSGDGDYNSSTTNFHYQYRGSKDYPTFHHKFGKADYPFWYDLKRQDEYNLRPWMWSHANLVWKDNMRSTIGYLTDENLYEFNVSGTFVDEIGTHIDVEIKDMPYMESQNKIDVECDFGDSVNASSTK